MILGRKERTGHAKNEADLAAVVTEYLRRDEYTIDVTRDSVGAPERGGETRVPIDIGGAVARTLDAYREQSEARGLCWETRLGGCTVEAEPGLLEIALRNLLGNAVKYARAGSTIEIQLSPKPSRHYRLIIRNEGPEAARHYGWSVEYRQEGVWSISLKEEFPRLSFLRPG